MATYHCPTCSCPPEPESMADGISRYYKSKNVEARIAQAALDFHKIQCHLLSNCERCRQLEKRLDQARYVGD